MITINKILLPTKILEKTLNTFRDYGNNYLEAFSLWVGEEKGNTFAIKNVWFPKQENTMISYYISDIDVHYINVRLNKKKYTILAQLHTHPGDAFHSCIDNHFSILTLPGSFSIVVPDFGDIIINKDLNNLEVYRLLEREWKLKSVEEVGHLFKLIK
ncbi:hypothetical protein LCGC14_1505140 [marine sediment metagenome]|uniref:JAB domain-containing protein n=1 Tax=marine sediment metagenome TaxID=412755 RepID=A0A0F9M4A0_9ZZZZ